MVYLLNDCHSATKEEKIKALSDIVYLCNNKVAPDFHGTELEGSYYEQSSRHNLSSF